MLAQDVSIARGKIIGQMDWLYHCSVESTVGVDTESRSRGTCVGR